MTMRHAIVINLDYGTHPYEQCHALWGQISEKMTGAGFRHEGRLFTIGLPRKEAYGLARNVIDQMEEDRDYYEKEIHIYLKEFYGFDLEDSVNLMLPPTDSIKLDESRMGVVIN
jgi:hypothetical protein